MEDLKTIGVICNPFLGVMSMYKSGRPEPAGGWSFALDPVVFLDLFLGIPDNVADCSSLPPKCSSSAGERKNRDRRVHRLTVLSKGEGVRRYEKREDVLALGVDREQKVFGGWDWQPGSFGSWFLSFLDRITGLTGLVSQNPRIILLIR
jgi:hypothetical protein